MISCDYIHEMNGITFEELTNKLDKEKFEITTIEGYVFKKDIRTIVKKTDLKNWEIDKIIEYGEDNIESDRLFIKTRVIKKPKTKRMIKLKKINNNKNNLLKKWSSDCLKNLWSNEEE